jgi:transcription factor AP-2, invertebrate
MINLFPPPQTQLSHGFPMAYTDRRGSDYGTSLSGSGSVGRLGSGPGSGHDHDPLSLHQALQNAVDDQEQNQVCDENATTFMTDLPLLKSEYLLSLRTPLQVRI